jgi:methionine synthase II (cobalamin-independent)
VLEARTDVVGSLLRPPHLLAARERLARGELTPAEWLFPRIKVVVLGLVTTKTPRRETVDELVERIREAAKVVSLERLALSPQCGFATSVLGNALSIDGERAKLRTIVDTAARVWA